MGKVIVRSFVLLVVLGLTGVVMFLLSERNARSYGVALDGHELVITRGKMLPWGTQQWAPADRNLAEAYAPIELIGESPGDLLFSKFQDRDELDRALFRTLRGWTELRVDVEDAARLREAVTLLRRMELLSGISDEQRQQLTDIRARIAWFEGKMQVEEALGILRAASGRLKLAAESQGRFSRDAGLLYDRMSPLVELLSQQARAADRREAIDPIAPESALEPPSTSPGLKPPTGTPPSPGESLAAPASPLSPTEDMDESDGPPSDAQNL